MKMKFRAITLFSLLLLVFATSCKKEKTQTKADMLTTHMLVYDMFYTNYGTPNQTLVYKKDAGNNTLDLSGNRVHFYKDGTYDEFTPEGTHRIGNWEFLNNETQVRVFGAGYNNTATIKVLTEDVFEWLDETQKTYGKQISKK